MKYAIWDICMSEKRCLEIQNRAFYGLFFKSIRYLKMSYIFTLHESYMKKFSQKIMLKNFHVNFKFYMKT